MHNKNMLARLEVLPPLLAVAIATRCGRRVQSIASRYFGQTEIARGSEHSKAIENALACAESLACGRSVKRESVNELVSAAQLAARAAKDASSGASAAAAAAAAALSADVAASGAHTAAATSIAEAEHAAHAQYGSEDAIRDRVNRAAAAGAKLASEAGRGYAAAGVAGVHAGIAEEAARRDAAEAVAEASRALETDMKIAVALAERGATTVNPMPDGPFGEYWPRESNEELEDADDAILEVEFEIPAGTSESEIIDAIREISLGADDLHRAIGGQGIVVDGIEISRNARVPEVNPHG